MTMADPPPPVGLHAVASGRLSPATGDAWCAPAAGGVVALGGRLVRADLEAFCLRVCGLLPPAATGPIVCDVGEVIDPDAVTVEAMARLQLAARRAGRRVFLRRASPELCALLGLMGLSDAVPLVVGSGVEPEGKPEEREELGGVEERRELDDPTA